MLLSLQAVWKPNRSTAIPRETIHQSTIWLKNPSYGATDSTVHPLKLPLLRIPVLNYCWPGLGLPKEASLKSKNCSSRSRPWNMSNLLNDNEGVIEEHPETCGCRLVHIATVCLSRICVLSGDSRSCGPHKFSLYLNQICCGFRCSVLCRVPALIKTFIV